jgi:hypothetical protein
MPGSVPMNLTTPVRSFSASRTEFVDGIAQQIRFRPTQFVTQFAEPLHPHQAIVLRLYRQLPDPLQNGHAPSSSQYKDDLRPGILFQSIRNLAKTQGRGTYSGAKAPRGLKPALRRRRSPRCGLTGAVSVTQHAGHWRIERMPSVDRNILRLAVYEMTHSVDEALELARRYSNEEPVQFVNGVGRRRAGSGEPAQAWRPAPRERSKPKRLVRQE